MSLKVITVACFLACIQTVFSSSVPIIKKCKITDSKCMKESAQELIPIFAAGIPEWGMETLEPLKFKTLDASSGTLKLKLNDALVHGLSKCIAKKIAFNENKSKLTVELLCTVEATAKYDMSGKVLVLDFEGNGDAYVLLKKILIKVECDVKEVTGSDGNPHWSITAWKHTYELKDKSTVRFDNLFNGNEVLGRAAKDLIESSPNEVVFELGPPILQSVVGRIIKNINKCFIALPVSSLIE